VTLDVNPRAAAREQALLAGRSLGLRLVQRKGNALVVAGADPEKDDPVRQAGEAALRASSAAKVIGRVGPAEVHAAADIAPLLEGRKPIRVMIGEGLVLDQLDATGLDTLPENLRLVAWTCSGAARELVDLASRLRGCVATADEAAGEAAANVVLAIKTSRDVPERIEIPVYSYRGTIPVGPGAVELGNRFTQISPEPTAEELAAASAALDGRTVGLIVPAVPGSDKETDEVRTIREQVEKQLATLGASVTTCVGAKTKARGCFEQLQDEGVVAIMPIATGGDLASVVRTAIDAGVMVIGVNETRLGDSGGVYVYVNPRRVARLSGRMAGAYADRTWGSEPVDAAVFNDEGAANDDVVANAVERALVQTDSLISPVARFASKDKTQVANAVRSMMRKYPSVRLIVGRHAANAAPVLIKKRGVNPDLVIYAQECTEDIVAAIDAGRDTGGYVKGCVDRNPAGAGKLAVDMLTRLAGGSRVPEVNEVEVIPYEPGFRG
jgi:ABC-type sugar transport system substrate-binding protein